MKKLVYLFVLIAIGFTSCKLDGLNNSDTSNTTTTVVNANQPAIDDATIQAYLKTNNITAQKDTASGLYYKIVSPGTGLKAALSSTVTVTYTGALISGGVFDSEKNVALPLAQLIRGWQIGLPFINAGGTIILYVPSALGYGTQGNSAIPANSVLLFNIQLISIQ